MNFFFSIFFLNFSEFLLLILSYILQHTSVHDLNEKNNSIVVLNTFAEINLIPYCANQKKKSKQSARNAGFLIPLPCLHFDKLFL